MRKTLFFLILVLSLQSFFFCRAVETNRFPLKLRGLGYGPFRDGQSPSGKYPATDELRKDLHLLKKVTYSILTYSSKDTLGKIPGLAKAEGLKVISGIWLGSDLAENDKEIQRGIKAANSSNSVCAVMVGDEVLLRGDLSEEKLIAYLNQVKSKVRVPVGTAETWSIWLSHPDLANAVDFILVNIHPYWDGIAAEEGASYVHLRYRELVNRYPEKAVVISETGWPAEGEINGKAVPGEKEQAKFISDFIKIALEEDIPYFIFEAFDEAWKEQQSGKKVEAHWGIFNTKRVLKPEMSKLIASPPLLIEISSVIKGGAVSWSKKLLKGCVYGVVPHNYRIVLYARTNIWYVQPIVSKPFTNIKKNGRWKNRTHLGNEYAALLVKKSFKPENTLADLPNTDGINIFAKTRRLSFENLRSPLPRLLGRK